MRLFNPCAQPLVTLDPYNPLQVQQVDAYTKAGHVLVVLGCGPVCPDVVFSLLAPLRSRSLLEVRPVVLLSQEPLQGPQWSAVAR